MICPHCLEEVALVRVCTPATLVRELTVCAGEPHLSPRLSVDPVPAKRATGYRCGHCNGDLEGCRRECERLLARASR